MKYDEVRALQHPSIRFIQGSVRSVDCEALSATIMEHDTKEERNLSYDYFVAATGLRRPWPVVPQSLTREQYLREVQGNIEQARNAEHGVVVIGGGAVGVEMAAELRTVQPETQVTLIHSRQQLLSAEPLPDELKDGVAPLVRDAGVNLVLGQRVTSVEPLLDSAGSSTQIVTLADGTTLQASHVIKAVSTYVPTTTYLASSSLDPEGYVKVAPTLHFLPDPLNKHTGRHFAAGDVALWSGIKRCGGAIHMGHFVAYNIHQDLISYRESDGAQAGTEETSNKEPKYLDLNEFPPVIGLAVGKKAISYGPAEGVKQGEETMQYMFGDDLAWTMCWNYLKLGTGWDDELSDGASGKESNSGTDETVVGDDMDHELAKEMAEADLTGLKSDESLATVVIASAA